MLAFSACIALRISHLHILHVLCPRSVSVARLSAVSSGALMTVWHVLHFSCGQKLYLQLRCEFSIAMMYSSIYLPDLP